MGIIRVQNQREILIVCASTYTKEERGSGGVAPGQWQIQHGSAHHSAEADIEIHSEKRDGALASHEFSFNWCLRATRGENVNGVQRCRASLISGRGRKVKISATTTKNLTFFMALLRLFIRQLRFKISIVLFGKGVGEGDPNVKIHVNWSKLPCEWPHLICHGTTFTERGGDFT
jgi:hypothetical protein